MPEDSHETGGTENERPVMSAKELLEKLLDEFSFLRSHLKVGEALENLDLVWNEALSFGKLSEQQRADLHFTRNVIRSFLKAAL